MSDKDNVISGEVVSDEVNSPKRREFLAKAGRFAVVTPVAVTVLLSTSMEADAHRFHKSGGSPKPGKKRGHNKDKWKASWERKIKRWLSKWA